MFGPMGCVTHRGFMLPGLEGMRWEMENPAPTRHTSHPTVLLVASYV